jgi:opacity protein-like surface antigen
MRRAMKTLLATAAISIVLAPIGAHAETYFNPWAGVYFGKTVSADPAYTIGEASIGGFGASGGDSGSVFGGDFSVGYSPNFFGQDSYVLDAMGGFTAGPTIGRTVYSVKPYVAAGTGLLRSSSQGASANNFGFNVGGGVLIYFSTHVGVRAEVRYLQTINGVNLGDFHFTRAQFGLLIR